MSHLVCGYEMLVNTFEETVQFMNAIPVAGDYPLHSGQNMNPKITRLKTSTVSGDRGKEGLRLEMDGQKTKEGKHKAIIEFICNSKAEEKSQRDLASAVKPAKDDDDDNDKGDDDDDDDKKSGKDVDNKKLYPYLPSETDDEHGGTLSYVDYTMIGDVKVLSLEWKTQYACEDAKDEGKSSGSGHWGFFTWLIIMYASTFFSPFPLNSLLIDNSVFLGTAAYLIFGSWLNYNRYSARGFEIVPHSETIRDIVRTTRPI